MPSIGSTSKPRDFAAPISLQDRAGAAPSAQAPATGNGIDYHGGPVMGGTVHIYYIWYGNWAGKAAPGILTDWANSIGGSPIYRINTSYSDNRGTSVSGDATFAGSTSVGYTHGNALKGDDVWSIVNDTLNAGALPEDTNGVYFVLTSADVNETGGFCSSYCGWHTARSRNRADIKFSFIGDASRCNGSCGGNSPSNGDGSADGMASIIYHELSETVSDPLINAWFDSKNAENGDLCAWKFGATYRTGNGGTANVRLGNRDYLLQENWLNANGGSCVLSGGTISVALSTSTGYELKPSHAPTKCADVEGYSTDNNANVSQYDCHGTYNQRFWAVDRGAGAYAFVNAGSGKCLDQNPGSTDGLNVVDWNCNFGDNQLWLPQDAGGGFVTLLNRQSGKVLEVAGTQSTVNGANIQTWTYDGSADMKWQAGPASSFLAFQSFNFPGSYITSRGAGTYEVWRDSNTSDDSSYRITPGLADAACVSFQSKRFPDRFLRHSGYVLWSHPNDGSSTFAADATFCARDGLTGGSSYRSFESKNFAGYYVRDAGGRLRIAAFEDNPGYRADASWRYDVR